MPSDDILLLFVLTNVFQVQPKTRPIYYWATGLENVAALHNGNLLMEVIHGERI